MTTYDFGSIWLKFPIAQLIPSTELLMNDCKEEVGTIPKHAFGSVLPRACGGDMLFGARNTMEDKPVDLAENELCEPQPFAPKRLWPAPHPETIDDFIEEPLTEHIENPEGPQI